MARRGFYTHSLALRALAVSLATVAVVQPAYAQEQVYSFDIPAQDLDSALKTFARVSGQQVVFNSRDARGKTAPALKGSYSAQAALDVLLQGSGLVVERGQSGLLLIHPPRASEASGAAYVPDEIIVTAQKRVESVQDVPIAITALSQKNLEEQKIESGADIMRAVPNLTFSKSNFSSYNISIRGIGTKAISATTDPGVAVSFNNTGLIQNRFFEQEFFDMERLEVLRGPQGTLYGRNATGGVINLITAKPKLNKFEGSLKGEVGNYNSRRMTGMLNIPIVPDSFGLRIAGAMTDRDGYDYNSETQNRINGRDLWSLRATLGFENDWLRGSFVWERFRENDNRSRTGKQLCHRDEGPDVVGSTPVASVPGPVGTGINPLYEPVRKGFFSTGCKAGSLYDEGAFGVPNGWGVNYISGFAVAGDLYPVGYDSSRVVGSTYRTYPPVPLFNILDPFAGQTQSRDLREISSIRDPIYRAASDLLQLNLDADVADSLTLTSQTAWNWDDVYSFQDYNRFGTGPIFNDTSGLVSSVTIGTTSPSLFVDLAPGGVFCDR